MPKVGFFTAVSFGDQPKSCSQSLLETVDSYFYLCGKKAYVIPGNLQQGSEGTILRNDSSTCLVTAIKVISYATVILPVIILIAKIVLRSIHTFFLIQGPLQDAQPNSNPINATDHLAAKRQLEEGIDIPQTTIEKIKTLRPKILGRQDDTEITWHARGNNLVFSLTTDPDLIFKMAPPGRGVVRAGRTVTAQQLSILRFANMVKAVEVCTANRLNLLVVPHAKMFNIDGMTLIAEERVNINQNESAQEHLYHLSGLNETARQLAIFIAKTGFSDVEWRNIPLIDTTPEFQGNRQIALVDLEDMDGADTGIFGGGLGRRGLIRCLHSEEQIDMVLAEAQRQGIRSQNPSPEQIKARRMEEIQRDRELHQFYERNGILENARKPIHVADLSSLDLNLEELGQTREKITLRDAVIDVIAQINEAIANAPENAAIKGKRYIRLNTNDDRKLRLYNRSGIDRSSFLLTEEEEQQIWLRQIINALVTKGHLFKLCEVNSHGYFIQA